MKAILTSIRPRHSCNILNLIKLWKIRKKFPKDYVGWVYIYVTKQGILAKIKNVWRYIKGKNYNPYFGYQGKVVARFWCDKVEEISIDYSPTYETDKWASHYEYHTNSMYDYDLKEKSCLSFKELDDYLQGGNGYAIHITKLEIFDKPKELYEFKIAKPFVYTNGSKGTIYYPLTRAPQSWCYIEV